jgi:hypothetical protein
MTMGHVIGMLPGFVVGCIVVFIAWGISALITGASRRKSNEQKDGIVSSIERTWTEADNLISSYKANKITETALKTGLSQKIDTINRLYKSSLHQLDIFFVKYTEKLLEEYWQLSTGGAPVDRFASEQPMVQEAPATDDSMSLRETGEETGVATAVEPGTPEDGFEITFQEEEAATQEGEETGAETTSKVAAVEDEPLVSAMSGMEKEEEQAVPVDVLLDLPQSANTTEEPVFYDQGSVDVSAELTNEQEQPIPISLDTPIETPEETQPQEMYSGAAPEQDDEMSGEGQFEITESAYPPVEDVSRIAAAEETMIDQPAFDYSAESAEASEATEASEQPLPIQPNIPPPFAPPPPRDRKPGYKRDETVEPATIYDIEAEAETIIADRNELLGTKPPEKEEQPKSSSSLGITGDDISTQLDNYFKL